MRRNYGGALKKGTLTEAALDQRMALVTPTSGLCSPLKDVDLVIEAVFESMEVKKAGVRKARSSGAAGRHSRLQHLGAES